MGRLSQGAAFAAGAAVNTVTAQRVSSCPPASAWEIATKYRLGKLPFARDLVEDFVLTVTAAGYLLLSISVEHALRAGRLPAVHKDPFDRMLAAQAIHEDLLLLSNDTAA